MIPLANTALAFSPPEHSSGFFFNIGLMPIASTTLSKLLSSELDAPAPCRLNAPDLDFACRTSADCLHQHQQVI